MGQVAHFLVVEAREVASGREHTWVATPDVVLVRKDKSADAVAASAVEKGYGVAQNNIRSFLVPDRTSMAIVDAVLEELGLARFQVEVRVTHRIAVPDAGS